MTEYWQDTVVLLRFGETSIRVKVTGYWVYTHNPNSYSSFWDIIPIILEYLAIGRCKARTWIGSSETTDAPFGRMRLFGHIITCDAQWYVIKISAGSKDSHHHSGQAQEVLGVRWACWLLLYGQSIQTMPIREKAYLVWQLQDLGLDRAHHSWIPYIPVLPL